MTAMHPGETLRGLRMRLGLTTRDVKAHTKKLADEKGNSEYMVSAPRLTQIENNDAAVPSIFKLYSLSALYKVAYAELLKLYGVNLAEIGRDQISQSVERTSLLDSRVEEKAASVVLPLRFDPQLSLEATTLVSRLVQGWGEVPVSLFQYMNAKKFVYGVIWNSG